MKFTYNNAKNANTIHTFFELNYKYYTYVFFKKNYWWSFKVENYKKTNF